LLRDQARDDGTVAEGQRELSLSKDQLVDLMQAVLEKSRPFRFRAKGWSMAPFIKDGDVIALTSLKGAPRMGDVVAALGPDSSGLIVHRVIARKGDRFLISGDNNPYRDGLFERENILARVTRVERDGRQVILGSGPERLLIVFLSRCGLLRPLVMLVHHIRRRIAR
jgi:phage repressor protein C with HTH and peptisase S24 domain